MNKVLEYFSSLVLSQGTGIVTGNSIDGMASAFSTMLPQASGAPDIDMSVYGTQIRIVMLLAFAANLMFARFTKWKTVFLTGHIVIAITYIAMFFILKANGIQPGEVWGYTGGSTGIFSYIFTKSIYFGVGVTILLLGVRMLIAELVPAFKGIAEKVVPGAIPALDCPLLFPFTPNALIIGFIVAMITSTVTILLTAGMLPTVIIPLTFTCFCEIGCAAIISNAQGGVRGCVIGTAVYGGQDFSLWGIIEGLIARLIG